MRFNADWFFLTAENSKYLNQQNIPKSFRSSYSFYAKKTAIKSRGSPSCLFLQ